MSSRFLTHLDDGSYFEDESFSFHLFDYTNPDNLTRTITLTFFENVDDGDGPSTHPMNHAIVYGKEFPIDTEEKKINRYIGNCLTRFFNKTRR